MSGEDGGHDEAGVKAVLDASGTQRAVQALLENLCHGCAPVDESPSAQVNNALDLLCDCAVLLKARERLLLQSQAKALDIIFQAHISAMIGVLNLFLDLELPYTWKKVSMIIMKAQGNGPACTCSLWAWVLNFVYEERLSLHFYG